MGITVRANSVLATDAAALRQARELMTTGRTVKARSADTGWAFILRTYGADFLTKVLHRGDRAGLVAPSTHWESVAKGDANPAVNSQRSLHRDLSWELVVASVAATFAEVEFREPDLMCTMADGTRVAVAGKVSYSERESQRWKQVKKGYQQCGHVDADADFVFVNMAQHVPISQWMRDAGKLGFTFADAETARDWSQLTASEWCDTRELYGALASIEKKARVRKREVGVAFFIPMLVSIEGSPIVNFCTHMPITSDGKDFAFATKFLQACGDALATVVKPDALTT